MRCSGAGWQKTFILAVVYTSTRASDAGKFRIAIRASDSRSFGYFFLEGW